MKLRKPRCSEATLLTSFPACHFSQGTVSAAGAAGSCATAASEQAAPRSAAASRAGLFMETDSLRHRLDAIPTRIPVHQSKKSEIADREDTRGDQVVRANRLQPQPHQRTKRYGEFSQKGLEPPAAVADRADRRAVQPRQEEKRHHRDPQQHRV